MTALDVADLVVIGGQVIGIGTGAALEQMDPQAAEAALAEAPVPLSLPDSYAAAAAWSLNRASIRPSTDRPAPPPRARWARP